MSGLQKDHHNKLNALVVTRADRLGYKLADVTNVTEMAVERGWIPVMEAEVGLGNTTDTWKNELELPRFCGQFSVWWSRG